MNNTKYEAPKISRAEENQAKSFYRVLDQKGFTIPQIGTILNHMGEMYLHHAKMVTETEKARVMQ